MPKVAKKRPSRRVTYQTRTSSSTQRRSASSTSSPTVPSAALSSEASGIAASVASSAVTPGASSSCNSTPTSSIGSMSLEQLLDKVGRRVRQEMEAHQTSATSSPASVPGEVKIYSYRAGQGQLKWPLEGSLRGYSEASIGS